MRRFLTEVILTPAGKVDEQSRLFQSHKGTPEVREIGMPDKLRAVEQLAKLCGWNEPKKLEHGASDEARGKLEGRFPWIAIPLTGGLINSADLVCRESR